MNPTEPTPSRRFRRFDFQGQARLYSSGKMWDTEVIDVSLRGALVVRPADFDGRVGANYRLELRLQGRAVISMGVSAANISADRIGLKCERLDWDSFLHLKRMIELNLGNPEELNRELSQLG